VYRYFPDKEAIVEVVAGDGLLREGRRSAVL